MHIPRIGVGVPSFGPHASPDGIVTVATAAERLGFHSVWTFERLLLPAPPDGDNPYGLPKQTASVYDPLETLTFVAAHTQQIHLGTSVLDALFHPPVVLARRLATLDRLSGGRVIAGIGQGWMPEEFTAAGVPLSRRGAGFEEYLAAMRACWAPDPVEYSGRHYQIPRSNIGPKTIQGRVPLFLGGISQPAIERAARLGDGFAAVFQDWDTTRTQIAWYRSAGGAGPVVLRVNPAQIDAPDPAAPFTGAAPAVIDDLGRAARDGVDEVIWDLTMAGLDPHRQVDVLRNLAATLRA
jgi:probable F420-dependent oxidoreductase